MVTNEFYMTCRNIFLGNGTHGVYGDQQKRQQAREAEILLAEHDDGSSELVMDRNHKRVGIVSLDG